MPREGGTEDSVTQKFTKGNMFTHHQKSVIMDAQDPRSGFHSYCCHASLTRNHDEHTTISWMPKVIFSGVTLVNHEGLSQYLASRCHCFPEDLERTTQPATLDVYRDPSMRQLVAFIGGLDLCDGRYDTSEHSLFHTLRTVHSEDFHQACAPNAGIKQGGKTTF